MANSSTGSNGEVPFNTIDFLCSEDEVSFHTEDFLSSDDEFSWPAVLHPADYSRAIVPYGFFDAPPLPDFIVGSRSCHIRDMPWFLPAPFFPDPEVFASPAPPVLDVPPVPSVPEPPRHNVVLAFPAAPLLPFAPNNGASSSRLKRRRTSMITMDPNSIAYRAKISGRRAK